MLYISTALYLEAQPLITIYSLKQLHEHTKFQVFANDNVCLIITGVGELKASIAITYLLSNQTIGPHDLFLNFGLCGSLDPTIPIGSPYVFHKLRDYSTKKDLYPDMLLKLPFREASLETCPLPVGNEILPTTVSETFVDMEAYAVMYAVTYYMQPHQVLFLKVISDYPTADKKAVIDKTDLQLKLLQAAQEMNCYLHELSSEFKFFSDITPILELSKDEFNLYQSIIQRLHLSETMSHSLKQHIIYYKSRHTLADEILTSFIKEPSIITCKSKVEGKKYFEQLKSKLME